MLTVHSVSAWSRLRHLAGLLMLTGPLVAGPLAAPPTGLALDGTPTAPFVASTGTRAVVLFFVAPLCPISNRYAPTIRRLASVFADQGIACWLVYADNLVEPADIRAHQRDYDLALPTLIDRTFAVADFAGAEATPEAAVFVLSRPDSDAAPRLVYRGRIDDQYEGFGRYRPAATQEDLRTILTAIAAGHPPTELTTTKAIGCYIPRPQ